MAPLVMIITYHWACFSLFVVDSRYWSNRGGLSAWSYWRAWNAGVVIRICLGTKALASVSVEDFHAIIFLIAKIINTFIFNVVYHGYKVICTHFLLHFLRLLVGKGHVDLNYLITSLAYWYPYGSNPFDEKSNFHS